MTPFVRFLNICLGLALSMQTSALISEQEDVTVKRVSKSGHVLFQSGFEKDVRVDVMDIVGSDGMDWQSDLEGYENVQGFWMYNRGDSSFARIVQDPVDPDNRCLYLQVDRGNRMQCELNFTAESDTRSVDVAFRVLWPDHLANLSQFPGRIHWFTVLEIWEHHRKGEGGDQAGKTRWTLSFLKDEGVGEPLYWGLTAEGAQPDWHDLWHEENRRTRIPFGRWTDLEIAYQRGKGEAGRFVLTMQPTGEERQVVFDVRRDTEHPVASMPLRSFQLWKLYTSKEIVDWMREHHVPISAYFDDFVWRDHPPSDKNR